MEQSQTPRLQARARPWRGAGEESPLLGYADLVIAGSFVISGIRILKAKEGGAFISFPSRKGKNDKWTDVAFPITAEARRAAQEAVLIAFERETAAAGGRGKP